METTKATIDRPDDGKLPPLSQFDLIIFVVGFAISAWRFGKNFSWSAVDWGLLTYSVLYGSTIVCPAILALQFWRGRKRRLFSGEVAWLVIAVALMPIVFPRLVYLRLLMQWVEHWILWVSPLVPLCMLLCTYVAWRSHFRMGRPQHWSHRLGLAISLAQSVSWTIIIIPWFGWLS